MDDALRAYEWFLEQGCSPAHVFTAGDSAGGGLCTTVLLAIRDKGLPLPAAAMPMSPWYDMGALGGTLETNADVDLLVRRSDLIETAEGFLGGRSPRDPLANPLYADLTGLPPMYIQVGGDEALLDDAARFEQRATAAGVDVTLDVFDGLQHVFRCLAGRAPEADEAIRKLADWARPKLGL